MTVNYVSSEAASYTAELMQIGKTETPFLSMIGGLNGGQRTNSFIFPMVSTFNVGSASEQVGISENDSVDGVAATSVTRSQTQNTCEIHLEAIRTSYKREATLGQLSPLADSGDGLANVSNNISSELDFQLMVKLKKLALSIEWSMLNGTYHASTGEGDAAKMGGITSFVPGANTVDASNADISKALIDTLMRQMADAGSQPTIPVLFCSMLQKQRISEIYGYVPESRNVGGMDIQVIQNEFMHNLGIVWCPQLVASTILIADVAECHPVFNVVPGRPSVFYESKPQVGASTGGMLYAQPSINIGSAERHGKITNLSTS